MRLLRVGVSVLCVLGVVACGEEEDDAPDDGTWAGASLVVDAVQESARRAYENRCSCDFESLGHSSLERCMADEYAANRAAAVSTCATPIVGALPETQRAAANCWVEAHLARLNCDRRAGCSGGAAANACGSAEGSDRDTCGAGGPEDDRAVLEGLIACAAILQEGSE